MNAISESSVKKSRRAPWWKTQQKLAFFFEQALRPLEAAILHDTRQRDVVGILRQLDVGIIDENAGIKTVKSFVEVQKRKKKIGIEDFGSWDYKRRTLNATEITIISEVGFSAPVIAHVKKLHTDTVRLGLLHPVETGLIERFNSTVLGLTRVWANWWFASIIVQYADDKEIDFVPLPSDAEEKIFALASPMDLIRHAETNAITPAGVMKTLNFNVIQHDATQLQLSYSERPLRRVIIVVEKQIRIWQPKTHFFAYDGVYPSRGQQGVAIISQFRLDFDRNGTLTLVFVPDPENVSGNDIKMMGQFEFT
jgi:hypothetical protein